MRHYFQLIRPHWTLASTLAVMVGIFQAWDEGYSNLLLAAVTVGGAFTTHALMEVWDELQDFAHYRKQIYHGDATQPPTLFSGGSGVLTGKLLTVNEVWVFFYLLLATNAAVLAIVMHYVGWRVLLCVAAGTFFLFGYNSKLKLSYIGLGEFANGISFGPILVFSAYLVMRLGAGSAMHDAEAHTLNLLEFLHPTIVKEALVIGIIWFGSLHIQEMQDYDEDKQGGKRTLVVRFGKNYASRVPFVCSIVNIVLVASLIAQDRAFVMVLPGALLNLYETFEFINKWQDATYFMRKLKSYFVYRNFLIVCVGMITSYFIKTPSVDAQSGPSVLLLLTLISSLPAVYFLTKNRVFKLL